MTALNTKDMFLYTLTKRKLIVTLSSLNSTSIVSSLSCSTPFLLSSSIRVINSPNIDEILPLFYAESGSQLENFTGMSIEKKMIGCKYFLIPYNIRMMLISDQQDMINWDFLLKQTKLSRESCVEAMRIKVGQYMRLGTLTLEQTQDFYTNVYQYIIWFNEANKPDFKQWLFNEVGSPYENNGFAQMPYFSEQMRDDLLDIYNGNY